MNSAIYLAPKSVNSVTPKVGDILVGSAGYEASISIWVKVVKAGKSMITVAELETRREYHGFGGMDWTSTPVENVSTGRVEVRRFFPCSDGQRYYIKWNSYQNLYLGDLSPREDYNHH